MKLNLDKQTVTAVILSILVGAILVSGFDIKINLTGEKLVQAVGLVAVIVVVFTATMKGLGGNNDD